MIELSIVVPAYNEEKNLPLIFSRFAEVIDPNVMEVIVVDDGSMDESKKVMRELAKKHKGIRPLLAEHSGYGGAINNGIKAAHGTFIAWTHADMQTDPMDVIKAYNLIKQQSNPEKTFVKGKRHSRPFVDRFFAKAMSVFELLILRKWLLDVNAQPNLFHRSLLENVENVPQDFSFDLYFIYMAKKLHYNIIRFPVLFPPRIHGESHWNTSVVQKWKFIKRTLKFSMQLKKRLKS